MEIESQVEKGILVCQICFEDKPLSKLKNKPKLNKIKKRAKCHKNHLYCQDCIAKYIHYKIQDKVGLIRCPGDGCTMELDPMAYHSLIPQAVFVEWCNLLAESWVSKNSRRRSMCPSEACSETVIDECGGREAIREVCPKCKEPFCFGCGQKWEDHEHTQIQHQNCSYEERIFISTATDWNWRRCPKCRFFVERIDGCTTIKCRCGTLFCYRCGNKLYRCHCWRTCNERNLIVGTFLVVLLLFIIVQTTI